MSEYPTIRPPAVAGMFYPSNRATLADEVDSLLAAAVPPAPTFRATQGFDLSARGYIYSGPIAASAYALLEPFATKIRRVVLLGPCHGVPYADWAIPSALSFATPLGTVPLDQQVISAALKLPQVIHRHDSAHAAEHSLEVQLPFLQQVLDDFSLVPFAVGSATPDEVAEVLDLLSGWNRKR